MQHAASTGAVVSVNHPKPLGPPWEYANAMGFHAIEVWNGTWPEHNEVSLAWWDSLLRQGRRVLAVGGSDTHNLRNPSGDRLGRPTTWAYLGADRSASGILSALRGGSVFVSHDVDGPQLYFSRDAVRVVDAHGATLILISERGVEHSITVASADWTTSIGVDSQYVRAEVRDARGEMLALSNPVWLD
jgi:hypothetical protein